MSTWMNLFSVLAHRAFADEQFTFLLQLMKNLHITVLFFLYLIILWLVELLATRWQNIMLNLFYWKSCDLFILYFAAVPTASAANNSSNNSNSNNTTQQQNSNSENVASVQNVTVMSGMSACIVLYDEQFSRTCSLLRNTFVISSP